MLTAVQHSVDTRFQGQLAYKARYAVSLFGLFSKFDQLTKDNLSQTEAGNPKKEDDDDW